MKKLILTEGTEFEQNGKDLAIIDTDQRGGKPIMLDSSDLDASIINGETQALDKISVDVSNEPQVEVVATTEDQTITPGEEYTGLSSVVVKGVTSDVDSDIQPENIIRGVNILGTEGTAKVTAYVLVDSNNYNTDANKATVLQIKQDIADGKEPLVYLYSRYENQGWNVTPCHYYLCCIPYNTDNGITFRTLIPYKESNQPVTMNGVSYNHIAMLTVWFNISNGVVTGTDNNLQRIPYPTLSYADNSPIGMGNTSAYQPTGDYNPATKKYVDDSIGAIQLPDITPYETYSSNIGRFPVFNWQPNIVMSGSGSSLGSSDLNLLRGYIQDMYNKGKPDFAIYCALKDDNGSGNYYVPHRFLLLQRHTKAIYAKPTSMQFVGFSVYDQAFNTAMAHTLLSLTLSWSGDTVTVSSGYITAYRRDYAIKSDLSNYLAKNNSTEFTPTGDYQPATKKYVDGLAGGSPKNIFEIEYDFSMMGTPQWYSTTDTLGVAYIAKINEIYKKGIDNFIIRIIKPDRSFYLDIIININRTNHTVSDIGINKGHWDSSGAGYVDKYFAIGTNYGNGFEYDSANDAFTHESGSILAFWISEPDLARKTDVVTKSNTTSYTPTADYNPATKKYVDDAVAGAGGVTQADLLKRGIYVRCDTQLNNTDTASLSNAAIAELQAGLQAAYDAGLSTVDITLAFKTNNSNTLGYMSYQVYNLRLHSGIHLIGKPTSMHYSEFNSNTTTFADAAPIKKFQLVISATWSGNTITVTRAEYRLIQKTIMFLDNTYNYTPTSAYNPASKKYVDDAIAAIPSGSSNAFEEVPLDSNGNIDLTNCMAGHKYLWGNRWHEHQYTIQVKVGSKTADWISGNDPLKAPLVVISAGSEVPSGVTIGEYVDSIDDIYQHNVANLYFAAPVPSQYNNSTLQANEYFTVYATSSNIVVNRGSGSTLGHLLPSSGGSVSVSGNVSFGQNYIPTCSGTPDSDNQLVNKKYVDDSVSAITSPALTLSNTSFDLGYDIEGETIEDDDITAIHTFAQTVGLASGGNKQITLNVTDTNSINRQFQAILHRTTTTASGVTTDVITIHCFDAAGMIFTLYTSKTSESGQEDILFGEYDSLGLVDFPSLTRFLTEISGYDDSKTQVLKNISGTLTWVDE